MRRAQRTLDNPALNTAIAAANALGQSVVVFFGLLARHPQANLRHYTFMIEGLAETAQKLAQRKCGFVLRICEGANSADEFARFCIEVKPSIVVCDEDPARRDATWKQEALLHPSAPLWSVDADVIVPSILLEKEQFAARTIRPRIQRRLAEFLKPLGNQSVRVPWNPDRKIKSVSVSPELIDRLHIDRSVSCAAMFRGGTDAALGALRGFIRDRLSDYASAPQQARNRWDQPTLAVSPLRPDRTVYRCALRFEAAAAPARDRDAFLEELIVRRELAVNFVRYNPRFKMLASVEPWARRTIREHARDARAYHYTEKQLVNAETHDVLWNAAQRQMVSSGWMHGYMRMYWAKKILEWSPSAAEAYDICVRLNDRYELDGRDPNGYAGVAWAIGGKHDRAWGPERPVYGKIRYMSFASTSRKFDSRAYIEKWNA